MSNKTKSNPQKAKGWKLIEPKDEKERQELYDYCEQKKQGSGKACFLDPTNLKYPICPKLTAPLPKCQVNEKGEVAALDRAREWHHSNLVQKVEKIMKK